MGGSRSNQGCAGQLVAWMPDSSAAWGAGGEARQGQAGWRHPSGCIHVTGNATISVFAFLLWHNQPNIGNLVLSLKPKSFSGLVSKGGLSTVNELITATTCYLLHGTVLTMCFLISGWAPESFYGITAWFAGRKEGRHFGIC